MKSALKILILLFIALMPCYAGAQSGLPPQVAPGTTPSPGQTPQAPAAGALQQAPAPTPSPYENKDLSPRDIYNLALQNFEKASYALAGEGFLKARDLAANDNELRFDAAFNLGLSLAKEVEAMGDPQSADEANLQAMVEKLRVAGAWYRDAVRQKPGDEDAKINLELILRRAQAINDILNTKYNTLEKQLESLIQEQRTIRENTRVLSERIQEQKAHNEPLHFSEDFQSLADSQRYSLTQANLVADNAFDQLAVLEAKTEDQLKQDEHARKFQLNELSPTLEQARQSMAQARTRMRELSIEDALRLSTAALYQLKRAREALQNPVQTLHNLLQDQAQLVRLSQVRAELKNSETLDQNDSGLKLPDWLSTALLNDTQSDLLMRTNRVDAFFKAMAQSQPTEEEKKDSAAMLQREQIAQAQPFVNEAANAMQRASIALPGDDLTTAIKEESTALEQLGEAAERFTDLKHLLEIIYAQQTQMRDMIPRMPTDNAENALPSLSFGDLQMLLSQGSHKNAGRLERLRDMIAQEAAKSQQTQPNATPNPQEDQQRQAHFERAEQLRNKAHSQNTELKQIIDTTAPPSQNPSSIVPLAPALQQMAQTIHSVEHWIAPAEQTQTTVEELRMMFFSIVEHIKELARQQENTLDRTADAAQRAPELKAQNDENALENLLQPITERETQHESMAEQLAQALAKQADQLQNQQNSQQDQQAAQMSQRYAQASGELQAGGAAMRQANSDLGQTLFTESMQGQQTAIEHLKKAIELLEPPQDQKQQQQQQQQQQQEQQKDKKMSQQQAENKLQQIREREKQRQNQQRRPAAAPAAVDKDW